MRNNEWIKIINSLYYVCPNIYISIIHIPIIIILQDIYL